MSKVIKMKAGEMTFLVETDDSVQVPDEFKVGAIPPPEGLPPICANLVVFLICY
jgi:hypothetical protein